MLDTEKKQFFEKLIASYPFQARFEHLLTQIQDVLEQMGITDEVIVNTDLLGKAIVDYFEDIDRLKQYEGITRANVAKIYAYSTYWLVKRSPIQLARNDLDAQYLYINEEVFSYILLAKMLKEAGKPLTSQPMVRELRNLLLYNLMYRDYNQKSLELMVTAFLCGCTL